jgi:hypothetical protein
MESGRAAERSSLPDIWRTVARKSSFTLSGRPDLLVQIL